VKLKGHTKSVTAISVDH